MKGLSVTQTDTRPVASVTRSIGGAGVIVVLACAALLTLPRLAPNPSTDDHGTFGSVAERLLAGDRLYVDVWDNKDPGFYYVLALGRLVSPLSDFVVEILWVLIACVSAWLLSRASGSSRGRALLVGGLTPVILTGTTYAAGMTHLPGVALSLAAIAAGARSRWLVAGAIVGLVLLVKLTMAPVAVAGLAVLLWHRRSRRGTLHAAAGLGTTLLGGGVLLAVRGELGGWLDNFGSNVTYSSGEYFSSRYGGPVGHLLRAFPEGTPRTGWLTLVVIVGVLAATWTLSHGSGAPRRDGGRDGVVTTAVMWQLVIATLAMSLLVLTVTATWPHHGQALGVPAVLALVLVVAVLDQSVTGLAAGRRGRGYVAGLGLVAVTAYALGGALHPTFYLQSARGLPETLRALEQVPATTGVLTGRQIRTYARAGSNDATVHALGLRDVRLVCSRFHQYAIEPAAILDKTADCLPRADALIVDDSVRPVEGEPEWNAYVARVRSLVATGYDCVPTPGAQVCVRQGG